MQIHRRDFLKRGLAAGALLSSAGALWTSCSGIRRDDLHTAPVADRTLAGLSKRHIAILSYASLAPSGHNSQPWVVRVVRPDQWIIAADPARRLPAVDPASRELMLSLGAFAENLSLAAGTFGFRAHMDVMATTSADRDVIVVRLEESKVVDYPLVRMQSRMTAKHGYRSDEIKPEDVAVLSAPLKDRLFYFARGTTHARCIEEGVVENFRIQSNRDAAQEELVRWLRLSNAEAEQYRDGLTTESMEIRGLKGWFVRNFVNKADFLKAGYRRQGADLTAELAQQGGGWFIITSHGNTVADWIDTGRRFQRLALIARERRIAIHPMTQILEEEEGRQQFAQNHGSNIFPQFVLRVGYLSRYPEPVSLRRPVSWFVKAG